MVAVAGRGIGIAKFRKPHRRYVITDCVHQVVNAQTAVAVRCSCALQEISGIRQNYVCTCVFIGRLCSDNLCIYVHIAADVGGIKDHSLAGVVLHRESGDGAQAENHDQYQKKTQRFFHGVWFLSFE